MKTSKSSSVRAFSKKAITLGLAAMMLVSCGKDKKKEDENNNNSSNAFTGGLPAGQICPQGTLVRKFYNFTSGGQLTQEGGLRGGAVYATYLGHDPSTGDRAYLREYASSTFQLELVLKCTGDYNIDSTMLNNQPVVIQTFTGDLNTPNKQQCPGKLNTGAVEYGYVQSQWGPIPIRSAFMPPSECQ